MPDLYRLGSQHSRLLQQYTRCRKLCAPAQPLWSCGILCAPYRTDGQLNLGGIPGIVPNSDSVTGRLQWGVGLKIVEEYKEDPQVSAWLNFFITMLALALMILLCTGSISDIVDAVVPALPATPTVPVIPAAPTVPAMQAVPGVPAVDCSWDTTFLLNASDHAPSSYAVKKEDTLSVRQNNYPTMYDNMDTYRARLRKWNMNETFTPHWPHNISCGEPIGIAAECDWAFLVPCFYGKKDVLPGKIFVHNVMLHHFIIYVLPAIPTEHKFVLVTSGTDRTIPTGSGDVRFGPIFGFNSTGGWAWNFLTQHPQIKHWYCENHDLTHPKVSTLPTGVVEHDDTMKHIPILKLDVPVNKRGTNLFVGHRLRTSAGQWELRQQVTDLCKAVPYCISPPNEQLRGNRQDISQERYVESARSATFLVCVHGGGLDPSPKAWEAMMMGTIPIIQHNTLDDAYRQFPVVFVDDFRVLFGDKRAVKTRLRELKKLLAPYYDDKLKRSVVLERLKTAFWVKKMDYSLIHGVPISASHLSIDF